MVGADVPPEQVAAQAAADACVWVPPLHACLPTDRVIPLLPSVHPTAATADDLAEGVGGQLAAALAGFQLARRQGAGSAVSSVAAQYHIDGAAEVVWRRRHREAAFRNDTGVFTCRGGTTVTAVTLTVHMRAVRTRLARLCGCASRRLLRVAARVPCVPAFAT